jgi:gluconokinase
MSEDLDQHKVFIIMGVSGSGKSSVAAEAARRTGAAFLDGDFLHPRENILKMGGGLPLSDEDRHPWLAAVNSAAFAMRRSNQISVIVCSALKRRYRDLLREGNQGIVFIHLAGSAELVGERLLARSGHFFKPELLKSQFEALEEPDADEGDVRRVEIAQSLPEVVDEVVRLILAEVNGL